MTTLPDEVLEAMARDLYGADAGLALADCRLAVEDLWNVITEKGYVVVPLEPTEPMLRVGWAIWRDVPTVERLTHCWRAMITAAQETGE